MMKVGDITSLEGRVFVTVVHYPGSRELLDIDRVRRASDGTTWKVHVTHGPVAYSEGGVVVGGLLGFFLEGDAVLSLGDELLPE